ncbi:MAG: hypothetical protein ABIH72_02335 [archaeon]
MKESELVERIEKCYMRMKRNCPDIEIIDSYKLAEGVIAVKDSEDKCYDVYFDRKSVVSVVPVWGKNDKELFPPVTRGLGVGCLPGFGCFPRPDTCERALYYAQLCLRNTKNSWLDEPEKILLSVEDEE